ncbi:class I SAM-dependent methyltransferase [Dechloromonas denitrificans]|uniref:class I SAM-dependent methyltransferase n=1 Tax=Dechloromonas denitrificans TaxID=281362 RepID=UPI001CF81DB7|nr:class I SAM-dependent methyltransferase [Dechloromonas denitrificans]UCV10584.1 class I SAM-dependent methyltransferase [Dechloromonas denitrificans]
MDTRLRKHPLGYWEIANKPDRLELQKYYAEKYYQEGQGSYELAYGDDELCYFQAKLEQRWAVLQQHLSQKKGKKSLLDVGCGEGYALAFFRAHGWVVRGLDFSSAGVESKNPDCQDALLTGDIFNMLTAEIDAGHTYDVVWLQNVLEHVIDPIDLLRSLRTLVSPGGLAVVTVPNDCSITQLAALECQHVENAFWVAPPDHLTYFDRDSLMNTADQTGWKNIEMLSDFPVDWFLFHPASNYVRNKGAGKAAHMARVQIENFIHKQPLEDVVSFWSAAAKLGLGRDITVFLRPTGLG